MGRLKYTCETDDEAPGESSRAWGRRLRETHLYEPRAQTLTFEQILRQQAYHFARVVEGAEAAYVPFVPR